MSKHIIQPIYFRNRGKGGPSSSRQRALLSRAEDLTAPLMPEMTIRRRQNSDGSRTSQAIISRIGEGVLPLRISRVIIPELQVYSDEQTYYMDSGYVQTRYDVDAELDDGIIWQTPETRGLYLNYEEPLFNSLRPEEGVGGGTVPPSFTQSSRWEQVTYRHPGMYTGKLKWLVAGKLFLKSEDPMYTNIKSFSRNYAANGRLSGEGIYTASNNRYWFLSINEDMQTGSATLLYTPLQPKVNRAITDGVVGDKLAQIETHALAIAQKTTIVLPINISGGPPGLPLAYGWHFNRNGHEAALVSHQRLDDEEDTFKARKCIANITKGNDSFSFSIISDTPQTWRPSLRAVFWKPFEDEDGRTHCPLDRGLGAYGEGSNTVFYCYYDADNVLQDCEYSTEYGETVQEHTNCDPTVINGLTLTTHVYRTWDTRTKDEVVVDGETIVSQHGTATGSWNAKYEQEETIIETPVYLACCQGQNITPSGYRGPCTADGFITYPTINISVPDLCPGDGTQCRIKRTWTAYYSDESWEYWKYTGGASLFSSVGIIFPFDCADGVIVIRGETNGGWGLKYASNPWPSPGREKWRKYTYEIEDCPGFSCGSGGIQETDKYMIYASEPSGGQVGFDYHFEVETERHFFHSHGHFERVTGDDDATGPGATDLWDAWLSKFAYPNTCGGMGSYQWQGRTPPVKSWVGIEHVIDGGFPEDANVVGGWA